MGDVFSGLSAKDFVSDQDTRIAYSKEITRRVTARSKVKPFIGKSEMDNTAIIRPVMKTLELGNLVGVELEDALTSVGATGNVTLDASSEELKTIKQFVKVDRWQHTVPSNGDVIKQRSAEKFKVRAKNSLSDWGTMKFDKVFFNVMSADCTNIVCAGHHDTHNTSDILKADVLTTADVEEAKRRALLGVDALGNEVPPLIPVRIEQNENMGYYEDVEFFVMLVGTNTARHIKNDANWAEARREALERGKTNPIFTGALGFWDGVLLLDVKTDTARQSGVLTSKSKFAGFSNAKTFDLSTYAGDSGQETEINLMLGAGAAHIVVDMGVQYYDYADKDDIRRMNASIDRVYGLAKTKYEASANDGILKGSMFDGKDYGVIAVVASTGV
jgi:N4-gp56 family major capsid protein